jgi:hypothetical protein
VVTKPLTGSDNLAYLVLASCVVLVLLMVKYNGENMRRGLQVRASWFRR